MSEQPNTGENQSQTSSSQTRRDQISAPNLAGNQPVSTATRLKKVEQHVEVLQEKLDAIEEKVEKLCTDHPAERAKDQ